MKKNGLFLVLVLLISTLLLSSCEGFSFPGGLVEQPSDKDHEKNPNAKYSIEQAIAELAESRNYAVNLSGERGGQAEEYTFELCDHRLKVTRILDGMQETVYYAELDGQSYSYSDAGTGELVRLPCEADANPFASYQALFKSLSAFSSDLKEKDGEYTLDTEKLAALGYSDLRVKYDGTHVVAIHLESGKYGEEDFTIIDLTIYQMGEVDYALPDEAPSQEPSDTNALLAEAIMAFLTMKNGEFTVSYEEGGVKVHAEIKTDGDTLYANPDGYEYYRVLVDGTYYFYERNIAVGEDGFRESDAAREFFEEAMGVREKVLNFAKAHASCFILEYDRYTLSECQHELILFDSPVRKWDTALDLIDDRLYMCTIVTEGGTYHVKTPWQSVRVEVPESLLKKPESEAEKTDLTALISAFNKTVSEEKRKVTCGQAIYLFDGNKRYIDDPNDGEEHYYLYSADGECLYTYGRYGTSCYRYEGFWGDVPGMIDHRYHAMMRAVSEKLDTFRLVGDKYVSENPDYYYGDALITRMEITVSGGYVSALTVTTYDPYLDKTEEIALTFSDFGMVSIALPTAYEEYK